MDVTLTDRYIAAATRTLPEKQRPELDADLRERIADQLDARREAGEGEADAERAVLTELGDPDALAAAYLDRPLQLIGPRYYLTWWRLVKLLWAIVPVCAAFGVALGMTIAGEPLGGIIGTVCAVVISTVVHIGFWTTLVFFTVERHAQGRDVGFSHEWTVDDLPEIKDTGAGLAELVASLVWLGVAAGAIVWDHVIGFVPSHPGLSFFAPELWPWWIAALFVAIVAEALIAVTVYAQGRWSVATAAWNAALNVAIVVPLLWLLTRGELIDPAFWAAVIPADSADTVATVASVLTGFGALAIGAWDSLDGFLKARRAAR